MPSAAVGPLARRLLPLVLSACCWGGCDRRLSLPELADLDPLAQRYDNPDGSLLASGLNVALREAQRRQGFVEDIGRLQVLIDVIEELLAAEDLPLDVELDGGVSERGKPRVVAELRHVCPGPSDYTGPPDAQAHGTLTLTAVATRRGLLPEVVGAFEQCQGSAEQRDFELHGKVEVRLDRPAGRWRYLARLEGRIRSPTGSFDGELDFRLGERLLEVRLPLSEGDLIAGLTDGGRVQLIRDRVATWACSAQALRCTRMDNGAILEAK